MSRRDWIFVGLLAVGIAAAAWYYYTAKNKPGAPGAPVLKQTSSGSYGTAPTWMLEWSPPSNASVFPDLSYAVVVADTNGNTVQLGSPVEPQLQLLPNNAAPAQPSTWVVTVFAHSAQANENSAQVSATVQIPASPKVTAASFVAPVNPSSGSVSISYTAVPSDAAVIGALTFDPMNGQQFTTVYNGTCASGTCVFKEDFPDVVTKPGVVALGFVQDKNEQNPEVNVHSILAWPSIGAPGGIHVVSQ